MKYKQEYKKRLKNNIAKVLEEIDNKDMQLKITNWSNKFAYSYDEIKNKIIHDEIFRCVFAKDPAKQNLYQSLAASYISDLRLVNDFQVLPAAGKKAIYLSKEGNIFTGNDLKNKNRTAKSIDFKWKTKTYTIYSSHKYTDVSGGGQDNQYKDIQGFIENARECIEPHTLFFAICDGDYYLKTDTVTKNKTKLESLSRIAGKNSFVLTIEEIKNVLEKI